jgi:hypothetical protein
MLDLSIRGSRWKINDIGDPLNLITEKATAGPRRMNKRQRREYVFRRSRELAISGKFSGWLEIELHLRFKEGFTEARLWLDSASVREELDMLCKQARISSQ